MTDHELLEQVRRLRAEGVSPKGIAAVLGVRPSVVAPLVRRVAAEQGGTARATPALMGCWVSPGWSHQMLVAHRDGWNDVDLGPDGPAGMALVLVAREAGRDRLSICGFLLDTFCLGVKNVIGPTKMRRADLSDFVSRYFAAFPEPPLAAPIELAQHLVFGSVAFAARLGFLPHPDFAAARGHLGELYEPCAITFGRNGRPLYVAGPHDDPIAVMETLAATVGVEGFAVAA
ncbi:MAG: helix-turn-helix domain-containing protein [Solirubrobacteraceae bacterium]|jgi:hypothetical protein